MTMKKRRIQHSYRALYHEVRQAAKAAKDACARAGAEVDRKALVDRFLARDPAPHVSTLYAWIADELGPAAAYPTRQKQDPNMAREQDRQPRGPFDQVEVEAAPEPAPEQPGEGALDGGEVVPVVTIKDGRVIADSRDVAAFFAKRHDNVMQAVRSLHCSVEFYRLNFQAFNSKGLAASSGEEWARVEMTKDGFMFLAMGFHGPAAGQLKELWLASFNQMDAELRALAHRPGGQVTSFSSEASKVIGGIVKAAAHAQDERLAGHAERLAAGLHARMELGERDLAEVKRGLAEVKRMLAGGFTFMPTMQADAPPDQAPPAQGPRQGKLPV